MVYSLILLQAAQPAAAPPDIQIDISATAQRVVVENRGRTDLQVRTSMNGREGDGNVVRVDAPQLAPGRREMRDVEVRVQAEARIATPQTASPPSAEPQEPPTPE